MKWDTIGMRVELTQLDLNQLLAVKLTSISYYRNIADNTITSATELISSMNLSQFPILFTWISAGEWNDSK